MSGSAKQRFPVLICSECGRTAVSSAAECPYCGNNRLRQTTRLSLRACKFAPSVFHKPPTSIYRPPVILGRKRDIFWQRIWRWVRKFFQS